MARLYSDNVADENKDCLFLIIQTVTEPKEQNKETGREEKDDKGYEKKGMPMAIIRSGISTSPRTGSNLEKAHLEHFSVYPKINLTRQISVTLNDLFIFVTYRFLCPKQPRRF